MRRVVLIVAGTIVGLLIAQEVLARAAMRAAVAGDL